jgi:hypothetical protein
MHPGELALSQCDVYWMAYDGVYTAPKGGGAPSKVVDISASAVAVGLAIDDAYVYWAQSGPYGTKGSVSKAPLAGGTPTELATGLVTMSIESDGTLSPNSVPSQVAVNATDVYFVDYGYMSPSAVMRVSKNGGATQTVATDEVGVDAPWTLVLDDTAAYWTNAVYPGGTVASAPLAGGALKIVADDQWGPHALAVRDGQIYWSSYLFDSNYQVAQVEIHSASLTGPDSQLAAIQGVEVLALAATGDAVYALVQSSYADYTGTLEKIDLATKKVTTIADVMCPDDNTPLGLATDDARVYWTSSENKIISAPR